MATRESEKAATQRGFLPDFIDGACCGSKGVTKEGFALRGILLKGQREVTVRHEF